MALRWKIPFVGKNGTSYTVNIYDDAYTGSTATTLTGAVNPFEVYEDDDDDVFTPVRTQSGYIRFIDDGDVLEQMFPASPLSRTVALYDGTGACIWSGYLSCEDYSQTFAPYNHSVEVPIIDRLGALDGVFIAQSSLGLISIESLLDEILDAVGLDYQSMQTPQSLGSSCLSYLVARENWLEWRDTLDNDGNRYDAKSYLDVLKDICTFFGMTCRQYASSVHFTMPDIELGPIISLDYKDADHTIDYVRGYSKVTVKSNVNHYDEDLISLSPAKLSPLSLSQNGSLFSRTRQNNDFVYAVCNGTAGSKHLFYDDYVAGTHSSYGGTIEGIALREGTNYSTAKFTDYAILSKGTSGFITMTPKKTFNYNSGSDLALGIKGSVKFANVGMMPSDPDDDNKKVRILTACLKVGNWYFDGGTTWHDYYNTFNLYISEDGEIYCPYLNVLGIKNYWKYESFDGFLIPLRDTDDSSYWKISGEVEFTIFAPSSSFDYDFLCISNLSLSVIVSRGVMANVTLSDDGNEYSKTLDNGFSEEYSVDMNLTTARGPQWGSGVVMEDENYPLVNVDIDYQGATGIAEQVLLSRAADFYATSHKKIVVTVALQEITPRSSVSINGTYYNVIAVSKNYHDSTMQLTLLSV